MFDKINPYEPVSDEEYRERARRLGLMLTLRPERHYQADWAHPRAENECGTAACVAGWATLWADGVVSIDAEGTMAWDIADMFEGTLAESGRDNLWTVASYFGREFLGLDDENAHALFYRTSDKMARDVLAKLGSGELDPGDVNEYVEEYED